MSGGSFERLMARSNPGTDKFDEGWAMSVADLMSSSEIQFSAQAARPTVTGEYRHAYIIEPYTSASG